MQELHDTVCCSASCCVAQLETLSHTFMGCPVVRPAVAWLGGLWSRVVAGVQLPLDARVLLAGDHTVWDPGGGDAGRALWTHLRLLFCRAVWHLRCHRVATGKVFTAAAVVGRAIRLEWLRVVAALTRARTLPCWCIIHKRFNPSQADFSKRWCFSISRVLTCLTYTSRRGSQHRGKQQNTKTLRPEKQNYTGHEQPPKAAALRHKRQAEQAKKGPDRTLEL
jgi:hypothetical protein